MERTNSGELDLSLLDSLSIGSASDVGPVVGTVKSIEDFNALDEGGNINTDDDPDDTSDDVDLEDVVDEVDSGEPVGSSDPDESPIKIWAQFASERGLIDLEEGEELGDDEEFLVKKFNAKVDKVVSSYKESLPDSLKELLDAHEKGIPLEDLIDYDNRIAEYSGIDSDKLKEDTGLQKTLVRTLMKYQDLDDESIKKRIDKLEDNLLLEDEAEMALKQLIKFEKSEKAKMLKQAEEAEKQNKKEYETRLKTYSDSVMGMEEVLPGIPVTKEQREAIIKMTTKPVAVLPNGMPISALKKMEMEDPNFMTKLAYVAGVLNWDLSTIERKAATKVTKLVKDKVNTYKDSPLGKLDLKTIRKAVKISKNQLFK